MPHILAYRPLLTQSLERQDGRQRDDEIGEWLHSQDKVCIGNILRDYMDSYSSNLLSVCTAEVWTQDLVGARQMLYQLAIFPALPSWSEQK